MAAQENTLCWYCDNACGNCDWSLFEKPIDKWIAKEAFIDNGKYGKIASYMVRWCPHYKGVVKGVLVPQQFIQAITGKKWVSAYKESTLQEASPIPLWRVHVNGEYLFSIRKKDYYKWKSKSKLMENDIEL